MSLKVMPLSFTFFISGLNSQPTVEYFNGMLLFTVHIFINAYSAPLLLVNGWHLLPL